MKNYLKKQSGCGLREKKLVQVMSKKLALSIGFFIFCMEEYIQKQEGNGG